MCRTYIDEGMDVNSPDCGYSDTNDFLKDDDTPFLDLDLGVEGCIYDDFSLNNKLCSKSSEQENQDTPSLPSSFRYYDRLGSPHNLYSSSSQREFHYNTLDEKQIDGDAGKTQTQREDSEKLCSSYLHDSVFQMDNSESILHDVHAHSEEIVSFQDANLQDSIMDEPTSPAPGEITEHTFTDATQNELDRPECVHRDTHEEVLVPQTETCSVLPSSHYRDTEIKIRNTNEELEPSHFCQEENGISREPYKLPNTSKNKLGSVNISDSCQSPGIDELFGLQQEHQIITDSYMSSRQTPSPIEHNEDKLDASQEVKGHLQYFSETFSQKNKPAKEMEVFEHLPQPPSSKPVQSTKHNGYLRDCHETSPDAAPIKKLSAQLSSSSSSRSGKYELDDKSNSGSYKDSHERSLHADPSLDRGPTSPKVSALHENHAQSNYSRSSKKRSISKETCKRKRTRSPSPDTGERNRKSNETGKFSSDSAGQRNSVSPRSTRQRPKHSSCAKDSPACPKTYNYRHTGRSISPSRGRKKDSSSGYKGHTRNKTRSRSPYRRDNGLRSPRGRRSRNRSPLGHHSLHRTPRRAHWSPPHNRSTGLGKPGRNLFIAGFNFMTTERDLERKFSRFGRVRNVRIVRDKRSGDSRGFGFLTLERNEQADAAIRALDKTEWGGRIVLVEKTKTH